MYIIGEYACLQCYIDEFACRPKNTSEYTCICPFTSQYPSNMCIYRRICIYMHTQTNMDEKINSWMNMYVSMHIQVNTYSYKLICSYIAANSRQKTLLCCSKLTANSAAMLQQNHSKICSKHTILRHLCWKFAKTKCVHNFATSLLHICWKIATLCSKQDLNP
jgi:hypothetical protein